MNTHTIPRRLWLLLPVLVSLLLCGPTAQATTAFAGSAALTFSVDSIANLDNPGDLSGLTVTGAFEQAPPPDSTVLTTGDGSIGDSNPSVGPIPVEGTFGHAFAVSGSASSGSVNSSHLGLFGLSFANTGSDRYAIGVSLAYLLGAEAHGLHAGAEVWLDYFNESGTFSGFDHILASVFSAASAGLNGSSGTFRFTLAPGGIEGFYADVRIAGNLEAAPVPLPAGLWLLLGGLSAVVSVGNPGGLRRRN